MSSCHASCWLLHRLLSSSHCATLSLSCRASWCCIASCRPLIALPSLCLIAPAGCRIASRRPLVAPPSRQLVAPACCRIASPRPLVVPRATLSSSRHDGWLLRCLSTRHPLVVLPSRRLAVSLSRRASSRCLVPPSNANVQLRPSQLSNADARRCHPPPLMSISIVVSSSPIRSPHRRH